MIYDVEEKSFDNFRGSLAEETHYTFNIGDVLFLPLTLSTGRIRRAPEQMRWIDEQLKDAAGQEQMKVLLHHCYPSDLKEGSEDLRRLISDYDVKLVNMGHTHYNEVSHDGRTIYTAIRSTGRLKRGRSAFPSRI